jgi:hypothetical protein
VPKYEYNGEIEMVFPSLGITVNKGDSFDGPEGLTAQGLSLVSSAKTAPAVSSATKEQTKETTTPPASSGTTAGA